MVLIQDILTDVKVQTPSYEMEKEYIGKFIYTFYYYYYYYSYIFNNN